MFQSNNKNNNMSSILGPELEINGDVKVDGNLLIYGKVYGSIQSKGSVRTAKGSIVQGDIIAREASISGEVSGNLNIESKVNLGKSSVVRPACEASRWRGLLPSDRVKAKEGGCSMLILRLSSVHMVSAIPFSLSISTLFC